MMSEEREQITKPSHGFDPERGNLNLALIYGISLDGLTPREAYMQALRIQEDRISLASRMRKIASTGRVTISHDETMYIYARALVQEIEHTLE